MKFFCVMSNKLMTEYIPVDGEKDTVSIDHRLKPMAPIYINVEYVISIEGRVFDNGLKCSVLSVYGFDDYIYVAEDPSVVLERMELGQ